MNKNQSGQHSNPEVGEDVKNDTTQPLTKSGPVGPEPEKAPEDLNAPPPPI